MKTIGAWRRVETRPAIIHIPSVGHLFTGGGARSEARDVIPFSYLLITASELYLHTIIIIYEFSHKRAHRHTVPSYYIGAVLSRDIFLVIKTVVVLVCLLHRFNKQIELIYDRVIRNAFRSLPSTTTECFKTYRLGEY